MIQQITPWGTVPYLVQNQLPQQQFQQQLQQQQLQQQQMMLPQQEKVGSPEEAMNRFLMRYPASMLVPGFISDALFNVNGRQFHTLSIEADGSRNLETFNYQPDIETTPVDNSVTRKEFQELVDKVNRLSGGVGNGISEPVQAAAAGKLAE